VAKFKDKKALLSDTDHKLAKNPAEPTVTTTPEELLLAP
jgi:hypothetical protein